MYACNWSDGGSKEYFTNIYALLPQGIMPNLFPEGKDEVMYNTVDASLLFINALGNICSM